MKNTKRSRSSRPGVIRETRPQGVQVLAWQPLLEVPVSQSIYVVCLSERIYTVATHWVVEEGKMIYCTGLGRCARCAAGWPPRVYGYFACIEHVRRPEGWGLGKLLLGNIPEAALKHGPLGFLDRTDLRGAIIELFRFRLRGAHAPIRIGLHQHFKNPDKLPDGWDVLADVARRFGLTTTSPDTSKRRKPDKR